MAAKKHTITVETEYMVLESKNPCPECGGYEWLPYIYEMNQGEFVPVPISVINIDIEPIIDEHYDNFCVDECLGCGIAVSSCSEDSDVEDLEDLDCNIRKIDSDLEISKDLDLECIEIIDKTKVHKSKASIKHADAIVFWDTIFKVKKNLNQFN